MSYALKSKIWTPKEDIIFYKLADKHEVAKRTQVDRGNVWGIIAENFPGKTAEQCRDHWRKSLFKKMNKRKLDHDNGLDDRAHKVARKELSTSPQESLNLDAILHPDEKGEPSQVPQQFQQNEPHYLFEHIRDKQTMVQAQQSIQIQQERCAILEEEKKTCQTTLTHQKQEKNTLKSQFEAAKSQLEEIKKDKDQLSHLLLQIQETAAKSQQTIQMQQDRCAAVEEEKRALQTALTHQEQEKNSFKHQFEVVSRQMEEIKKEKDILSHHLLQAQEKEKIYLDDRVQNGRLRNIIQNQQEKFAAIEKEKQSLQLAHYYLQQQTAMLFDLHKTTIIQGHRDVPTLVRNPAENSSTEKTNNEDIKQFDEDFAKYVLFKQKPTKNSYREQTNQVPRIDLTPLPTNTAVPVETLGEDELFDEFFI